MPFVKDCHKSTIVLDINGQEKVWKPSVAIRNKFCTNVAPRVNEMLELSSFKEKFVQLVDEIVYQQKKEKLEEFIQTVIDIAEETSPIIEERYNIKFPVITDDFEDPMKVEEFRDFHLLSLALKLASFVMHYAEIDKLNINPNYILDRLVRYFIKEETMKKIMVFINGAVLSSMFARESMWNYLIETIGITPERHIQLVINYFFKAMMVYYDAEKQPNVMSYLAGLTNQSLYYLYTDSYDRYVQYVNIAKVRFTSEYQLVKQQAVFRLFDMIVALMKQLYPQTLIVESDLLSKTYDIVPYAINQRGIQINPISKYFTYPLLSRIWNIPSHYFNEYKNLRYIELYMSLVVDRLLKMPYLAKLMRSIVVDKHNRKLKINRLKLKELEKLKFPEMNIFKQKHMFENIVQEVKNYTYYDPILHDVFIPDIELFLDEMKEFYKKLLTEPDSLKEDLKPVILWYNVSDVVKPQELEIQTIF